MFFQVLGHQIEAQKAALFMSEKKQCFALLLRLEKCDQISWL